MRAEAAATISSRCDGGLDVALHNGRDNDTHDAGGSAHFVVTAAGGFSNDVLYVNPAHSGTVLIPTANAAWVTVASQGMATVTGGYHAAPGCYGYTPPPAGGGSGGGAGGGGGTAGPGSGGNKTPGATLPAAQSGSPASGPSDADSSAAVTAAGTNGAPVASDARVVAWQSVGKPTGTDPARWVWGLVLAAVAGLGVLIALRRRRAHRGR